MSARGRPVLDERLRPLKDAAFEPVARLLNRRVHPHWISLAGVVPGVAAAVFCGQRAYGAGLACWVVNRLFDGLDGVVSRMEGRQSDFGGYLDIVLDYVAYAAIPIGLVVGSGSVEAYRAGVVLLGSFLVNAASWMYLAAVLERRNLGAVTTGERTTITMPSGLIGGTETIVFYTLFILFPGRLVPLFGTMAALVLITIVQRAAAAARVLGP